MKKHASNASYFPAEQLLKEVELEIGGQRVRLLNRISPLFFYRLAQDSNILTLVSLHPYRRLTRSTPTGSASTLSCTTPAMRSWRTGGWSISTIPPPRRISVSSSASTCH